MNIFAIPKATYKHIMSFVGSTATSNTDDMMLDNARDEYEKTIKQQLVAQRIHVEALEKQYWKMMAEVREARRRFEILQTTHKQLVEERQTKN